MSPQEHYELECRYWRIYAKKEELKTWLSAHLLPTEERSRVMADFREAETELHSIYQQLITASEQVAQKPL